jgi:hypothetical protein
MPLRVGRRPPRAGIFPDQAMTLTAPALRTVANDADGNGRGGAATVRANPLKTNGETAADDVDPNRPPPHS